MYYFLHKFVQNTTIEGRDKDTSTYLKKILDYLIHCRLSVGYCIECLGNV